MTIKDKKRFWSKVEKTNQCWIWVAGKYQAGYGCFHLPITHKADYAHRVSWRMKNGDIPEGLDVCHKCDNPSCVRPGHLFLGTAKDNAVDMVKKGRNKNKTFPGSKNHNAKLTEKQVLTIRAKYSDKHISSAEVAKKYRVTKALINMILSGKAWKHIL